MARFFLLVFWATYPPSTPSRFYIGIRSLSGFEVLLQLLVSIDNIQCTFRQYW